MYNAEHWKKVLNMTTHREGGSYFQSYAADYQVSDKNQNTRPAATSIYFLLEEGDYSAFHRLQADEVWYFHDGQPLSVWAIDLSGALHEMRLGLDVDAGEHPQVVVPAGWIFGSVVDSGYALVGCAVAPGFDYQDFELLSKESLLADYPEHHEIIDRLAVKA
ncbi:cupin domain-containing protein [Culicoidibacter larvae]|uniref:Cupin domain-containing protein n=1 Tax=Culicoidibacter larvae TaxID=2579976 RepID=A0A5R8QCZ5_9FIRM|nr:cupin domain-containing protein [Culicoidibacter larvae]TLG72972.1 cupin domain-containing protein [Culicoidibacter larvae]